jgi:hypothetical protein
VRKWRWLKTRGEQMERYYLVAPQVRFGGVRMAHASEDDEVTFDGNEDLGTTERAINSCNTHCRVGRMFHKFECTFDSETIDPNTRISLSGPTFRHFQTSHSC